MKPRAFLPGDRLKVRDAPSHQGSIVSAAEPWHGLVPVRPTQPAHLPVLSYPVNRLELLSPIPLE